MSDSGQPIVVADPDTSRDNEVRPFRIEAEDDALDMRGRAVRLGTVAEQVLAAHDYPEPVARILGELLVMAALLGSMLKAPGVVTVQTKSEGPVPMMVADFERLRAGNGALRGYADIDSTKYAQYGKTPSFKGLIGCKRGYLALTIDPGGSGERYQGIVDLSGDSLAEVAEQYFRNSEQTPTALCLMAARNPVTGHWRAGGTMLQHLSRGEEGRQRILSPAGEDAWERAQLLLATLKGEEMLDPQLTLDALLYRLYHEEGVRVFDALRLEKGCRCDRARLQSMLANFSADDRTHMTVDGKISVNCQFCNKSFDFDPASLPLPAKAEP